MAQIWAVLLMQGRVCEDAMSTKYSMEDISRAADAVSQMFAQVKSEPTPAEAALWTDEIERLGPDAVLRFARFWMAGGGQDGFFRAPRIVDLRKYFDPTWMDVDDALARLRKLVIEYGPYREPDVSDADAALIESICLLGGWSRVCEIMPDEKEDFAWKSFQKKFESAWQGAIASFAQGRTSAIERKKLVPLGFSRHDSMGFPGGSVEIWDESIVSVGG